MAKRPYNKTFKEFKDEMQKKNVTQTDYWDNYMIASERNGQTSHRAHIGNRHRDAVKRGEMKFVPSYNYQNWDTDTREDRTKNVRNNAKQVKEKTGFTTKKERNETVKQNRKQLNTQTNMEVLREAFKKNKPKR